MAFLEQAFNVEELPVSVQTTFEPLPEGWYTATISGAEIKTTKAGNGQYINVKYSIIGPTHQGRMVFGMINIKNPNPKAEEIGRQQLGDIMRAIGLTKVSDTDQLIGGNLSIKLVITPADGTYEASNNIRGFKAVAGGISMPSISKPLPTAAQNAVSDKTPPWAAK
jgi:hypothetical protein